MVVKRAREMTSTEMGIKVAPVPIACPKVSLVSGTSSVVVCVVSVCWILLGAVGG